MARIVSPRILITLGLTALGLALGIGGGIAIASRSRPVDVAFLGDSYTFGYGASEHTDGFAYDVARAEHWTAAVVGLPGSGYAHIARYSHKRIAAGIGAVIAARPKLVIVECGHNDAQYGAAGGPTYRRALADLLDLRRRLPRATIVVVGPVWLDAVPTAHALLIRDVIHDAQRQVPRTLWIDPIAQRWFTGRLAERTADDATMINYRVGHPDDAGYAHMARRLEADLRALHISA